MPRSARSCALHGATLLALASLAHAAPRAQDAPRPAQPPTPAQPPAAPPPPAQPQPPAPPQSAAPDTPDTRVVVHTDRAPADTRDSRVTLSSGMRISMPAWASPALPTVAASSASTTSATRSDGLIEVPSNTLGPGEPLWKRREREDAARKLAQAEADYAADLAERADREFDIRERSARYGYYPYHHGGFYSHSSYWPRHWPTHGEGPTGPVTTTITRFNDLGSEAQRNFADAAYPRNQFEIDEARSRAILQFGRDAEPNIRDAQRARDEAHRNANRNTFKPPTTTEPLPQRQPPK